jgi:hypothetical protein
MKLDEIFSSITSKIAYDEKLQQCDLQTAKVTRKINEEGITSKAKSLVGLLKNESEIIYEVRM